MNKPQTEKFEFQSEIKQLLNIIIFSLYKNKDVFLRELVSNAVDALNKVQFEMLTQKDVENPDADLRIDISFSKTQNKLTVEDTGIGMTREELIENIGTIAHSGTIDFLQKLSQEKDKDQVDLIGKFGVGFYASFMVAKEINIITKSFQKGAKAFLWKSSGQSDFTIEETVKKIRGTRIELFLKNDEKEFLDKYRIQNILSHYSRFIPFPVYIEGEKLEVAEAIWSQPKSSLKKNDYKEFYKFLDNIQEEPETYLHLASDAPVQFQAILFVPKTSVEQWGLFRTEPGVDLYSKKVLIQKGSKDILPEYLRFVKGVVDSEDIPLNISRETIQNSVKIQKIRTYILTKLFNHLKNIKNKEFETYKNIWDHFSRNFKEGIVSDMENKEKLADLLLFSSSKEEKDKYTDLKKYVERMPKEQKEIYHVLGMDRDSIEKNPALEAFKKKEWEVLFLTDPLDEVVLDALGAYQEKSFKAVESAEIELEKKPESEEDSSFRDNLEKFIGYLKGLYGDRVADVRVSKRLVDSPALLAHSSEGPSLHMEKIIKMMNKEYTYTKKILEINPENPLIKELVKAHQKKGTSKQLEALSLQLLDNLVLREGILDDIDRIVPRIQDIMLQAAKKI
ncbi:MAG: molecular chaperone HtpG [Candidatus Aminicenantes bacterium]|nr:molecular chaperone HtpG [Candidatus Aminicenantes bacterium]